MSPTSTQRLARLERATAQLGYQLHGAHSMPNLRRQAPDLADLITEWINGTSPASESNLVGRVDRTGRENTDDLKPKETR